jgi:hypothetical protein
MFKLAVPQCPSFSKNAIVLSIISSTIMRTNPPWINAHQSIRTIFQLLALSKELLQNSTTFN